MAAAAQAHKIHDDWLEKRFPKEVLDALSDEQMTALGTALRETSWKSHPVDIRLTFPFLTRKYFLTIIGGVEKRSTETHPAGTLGPDPCGPWATCCFLLGIATLFYMAAVAVIFFYSDILQF